MARVTRRGGRRRRAERGNEPLGWRTTLLRRKAALGINEHAHGLGLPGRVRAGRILVKELYPAGGRLLGRTINWGMVSTVGAHTALGRKVRFDGISLLAGTKLR